MSVDCKDGQRLVEDAFINVELECAQLIWNLLNRRVIKPFNGDGDIEALNSLFKARRIIGFLSECLDDQIEQRHISKEWVLSLMDECISIFSPGNKEPALRMLKQRLCLTD